MEREPKRCIYIKNPETYKGKPHDPYASKPLNSHLVTEGADGYFVNGLLNITDGTFLHGFHFSDIKNGNLVIGPYPLYEIDVDQIASTGVSAVINLQTQAEQEER